MPGENDISGKVGLDYSDFQRGVTALNQQIKNIEVSFRGSAATMDDWSGTSEGLGLRISTLNEKLDLQKTKLKALTDEFNLLNNSEGDHSKEQQQLAGQMAALEKQIGSTQGEIKKYSTALDELEGNADEAGTEVKNLGDDFDDAGKKALSFGDVLKANVIGDAIVDGIRSVGGAVKDLASDALESADSIQQMADQTGLSAEKIQELTYVGDTLGVSIDTQTGAFSKLINNMSSASAGSGTAYKAFQQLGVSVTDSNGKLRDSNDVYNEVLGALGNVSSETERTAISQDIFGKSAADLNPLISAGTDQLNALAQQAQDTGAIMSGDTVGALDDFGDTMGQLKQTAQSAAGSLLEQLLPSIQPIIDKVKNLDVTPIANFLNFILNNGSLIATLIAGVGTGFLTWKVTGAITGLISSIQGMVAPLFATTAATEGASAAQRGLNAAQAANPIGLIITIIAMLVTTLLTLWNTNEGFRNAVISIWNGIKSFLSSIGNWFATDFVGFFKAAWNAIKTAWSGVISFFRGIWSGISGVFASVGSWFAEKFREAVSGIKSVWNGITGFFQTVWSGIKGVFASIGSWFREKFNEAVSAIKSVFSIDTLKNVGHQLIEGLWNGISNAKAWIISKIGVWKDDVVNAIKKFFGIASPSKLFRDEIGKYLVLGLAEGIVKNTGLAINAVIKAAQSIGKAISGGITNEYSVVETETNNMLTMIDGKLNDLQTLIDTATDEANKAALQNEKTALEGLKSSIESTVRDTQNDISGLASKLAGLGSLTTTTTTETGEKVTALTSLDQTLATIQKYSAVIAKLKERGVSARMLNYVLQMSPEEAINAANLLLDLSDSDWNKEMFQWDEIQSASQQVASESYAQKLASGIASDISSNADAIKTAGVDLGTNLINSMQGMIDSSVTNVAQNGYSLGKNAADGVAEGFEARRAHVASVFKSVLQSAMQAAKDFLGIASPSKLFRDEIGVYLAQGVGVGFTSEMAAISQQMNKAIPASFNAPTVQTQSSAQVAEGAVNGIAALLGNMQFGGGTYQINVNIDGKTAASALFDPLQSVAMQKGASFA